MPRLVRAHLLAVADSTSEPRGYHREVDEHERAKRWLYRLADGRRVTVVWLDDQATVFLSFADAVWVVKFAGRA